MNNDALTHIHLIGNPEENFYALGKRDKNAFNEVYKQLSRLCIRNNFMSKILSATTEFSKHFIKKSKTAHLKELKAYAEGLERPYEDVLLTLVLPEMVASFNKWAPDLLSFIPGCSSLFVKDNNSNGIIHTRILDYALSGPFEKFERSILYEFQGRNKVFSFSSAALPFPGLSAMNDKGLTLALHYKHGQHFNLEGESIFLLASDILFNCSNTKEALKFIKNKSSISFWGLYLSDKNGDVISIDICGKEVHQEKFDITDHSYLYFNNRSLLKKPEHELMQPFGNLTQCNMRKSITKKRMKNFDFQNSKDPMLDALKLLGSQTTNKINHAKNYELPPITPSSIQLYAFNNSKLNSYFVRGKAPKYFEGSYLEITNLFSSRELKEKNTKASTELEYSKGQKHIADFQTNLDKNEITHAYHSLQMAILYSKDYEEESIYKFYFHILEYIYESDQRDLTYLYQDFEKLENKLPAYLNDHRLLFLLRISKLLGQKVENHVTLIQNNELKKIYRKEFNLNSMAIKGLKYLIFPRIEILDIIYAY